MVHSYDAIIIGGGIAGAALAITLKRAGLEPLLLERSEVFEDRVRGEWIAPWGVAEARSLGLYELLLNAGGHHLDRVSVYDDSLPPDAFVLPFEGFAPGVRGPLCLGHPAHCQALFEEAQRAGVDARRGVEVTEITLGARPQVTFTEGAHVVAASGRIIVGADGRNSQVREAAGISLHQDRPHHFMGGILVEDAYGWDERLQGQGAGDGFYFFAFPQGSGGYGRTAASL